MGYNQGSNPMQCVKTIATTAAFVFTLSGCAFAQGALGDGGRGSSAVEASRSAVESAGSAVESGRSAVESARGAVESSPTTGSGFGSGNDSSTDSPGVPYGSPALNLGTWGANS